MKIKQQKQINTGGTDKKETGVLFHQETEQGEK